MSLLDTLWAYIQEDNEFLKINFESMETETIKIPLGCDSYILPSSSSILCDKNGQVVLLDINSGKEISLGLETPLWLNSTGNGKYLYYGYANEQDSLQTIGVFDIAQMMEIRRGEIDYSDWHGGGLDENI